MLSRMKAQDLTGYEGDCRSDENTKANAQWGRAVSVKQEWALAVYR